VEAFAAEAKKIHIDIDPSAISKNVQVDVPIVGDVKSVLSKLNDMVRPLPTADWLTTIQRWREEHPLRYISSGSALRTQHVIRALGDATGGDAIVVTDVGQHQMWAAQFFTFQHPRTMVTSGGLGTMGFSLPAAMGAAFANSSLPVISISGDGGFQMNAQELATIAEHKLPIKIFIMNNGFLGMVRQWQELFWRRRYSQVHISSPDFVKLADAFGIPASRVTHPSQLEAAVRSAMEHKDGPVLVECVVAQEDNVYPMIPAGQTVNEIIDTPEPKSASEQVTILEKVKGRHPVKVSS
jgi:acetolactate synthase-1/2/3 large subunit